MNSIEKLSKALLLSVSLSLSACKGFEITKGEVCKEIPFIDAPEGYCAQNTYPIRSRHIPANQWAKMRAEALMISPEFYTEIKKGWLKACRNDDQCKKELQSLDDIIQKLDALTKSVLKH